MLQHNESHTKSGVPIFFHSVITTILVPSSVFWRAAKLLFGIKITPAEFPKKPFSSVSQVFQVQFLLMHNMLLH